MTQPAVTAVVFDLGNVLIEWNRDLLYRKVIPDEERRAQFFRDIATMEWNLALDRGVPFDVGVAELSAEHPAWSVEIEAYRDRWSEMLGPPDDDAVQLAADVRAAGVGTYGLTNWSAETFPIAEGRHAFLHELSDIVVSGREGVVKPDRAIFDLAAERFGQRAGELLFFDDSPPNVEGAAAAGWQAHLWTGAGDARQVLRDAGVL